MTQAHDAFALELEALGRQVRSQIGEKDLCHIRRVAKVSKTCGAAGRALIALSLTPFDFFAGVLLLTAHEVLEAVEIGHSVLHGAYDGLDPTGRFHARSFRWGVPIDERAWHRAHNLRHHPNTNVVGRDGDVSLGFVRLVGDVPHRPLHYVQLPALVLGGLPNFTLLMQMQFSGVFDLLWGERRERGLKRAASTVWRALQKPARHIARRYLVYALLAGPFAGKMVAGTWASGRLRDIWVGLVILCGHAGDDVVAYPAGTRAESKGDYFRMQAQSTNDFELPRSLSWFAGALDHQIEHHLFPDLPPNRVREIAPRVREICERHGVRYQRESMARTVKKALAHIGALSLAS